MSAAALLCGVAAHDAAAAPLTVATPAGALQGKAIGDTSAYLGIPYAAPPIGKLRWARPQPMSPWPGLRPATAFGEQCPSFGWGRPGQTVGSEDCLFLNVYVPRGGAAAKPVAVWFHGGGFTGGASQDVDPSVFAAKADVIVVTVNYRLGALGFASLPELDAESPTHSSGNYALMDQQAALRWVQHNIKPFGGDPRRVTAIGESAGAFSIWSHIASPQARGLFQRAITMSGPNSSLSDGMPMVERAVEQARGASSKLAAEFGCGTGPEGLACLRAVPASKLVASANAAAGWPGWTIILDGDVLPEQPRRLRESGQVAKVPVLSGNTENEGGFFTQMHRFAPGGGWTEADYRQAIAPTPFADQILAAYPPTSKGTPDDTFAAATSDQWACGTDRINTVFSALTTVYAYEFADRKAPPTLFSFPGATGGAFHTAEIPYVFQTPYPAEIHAGPPTFSPEQAALSDRMMKAWAAFIWGRDPAADWPRFNAAGQVEIFAPDGDQAMSATAFRQKHNCDFWDKTQFGDWMVNTANLARRSPS